MLPASGIQLIFSSFQKIFGTAVVAGALLLALRAAANPPAENKPNNARTLKLDCVEHRAPNLPSNPKTEPYVRAIVSSKPICERGGQFVNAKLGEYYKLMQDMNAASQRVAASAVKGTRDAATALAEAKRMISESITEYRRIAEIADREAKELIRTRAEHERHAAFLEKRHKELLPVLGEAERQQRLQLASIGKIEMDSKRYPEHKAANDSTVSGIRASMKKREEDEIGPLKDVIDKNRHLRAQHDQSKIIVASRALSDELTKAKENNLFKARQMEDQLNKNLASADLSSIERDGRVPIKPVEELAEKPKPGFFSRVFAPKDPTDAVITPEAKARESLVRDAILEATRSNSNDPSLVRTSADESAQPPTDPKTAKTEMDPFSAGDGSASEREKLAGLGYKNIDPKLVVTDQGTPEANIAATLQNVTEAEKARLAADRAALGGNDGAVTAASTSVDRIEAQNQKINEIQRRLATSAEGTTDGMHYFPGTPDPAIQKELADAVHERNRIMDDACKNAYLCNALTDNGVNRRLETSDLYHNYDDTSQFRKGAARVEEDGSVSYCTTQACRATAFEEQNNARLAAMDKNVRTAREEVVGQERLVAYDRRVAETAERTGRAVYIPNQENFQKINQADIIGANPLIAGAVAASPNTDADATATIMGGLKLANERAATADTLGLVFSPASAMVAWQESNMMENQANLLNGNAEARKIADEGLSNAKFQTYMAVGSSVLTLGTGGPMTGIALQGIRAEVAAIERGEKLFHAFSGGAREADVAFNSTPTRSIAFLAEETPSATVFRASELSSARTLTVASAEGLEVSDGFVAREINASREAVGARVEAERVAEVHPVGTAPIERTSDAESLLSRSTRPSETRTLEEMAPDALPMNRSRLADIGSHNTPAVAEIQPKPLQLADDTPNFSAADAPPFRNPPSASHAPAEITPSPSAIASPAEPSTAPLHAAAAAPNHPPIANSPIQQTSSTGYVLPTNSGGLRNEVRPLAEISTSASHVAQAPRDIRMLKDVDCGPGTPCGASVETATSKPGPLKASGEANARYETPPRSGADEVPQESRTLVPERAPATPQVAEAPPPRPAENLTSGKTTAAKSAEVENTWKLGQGVKNSLSDAPSPTGKLPTDTLTRAGAEEGPFNRSFLTNMREAKSPAAMPATETSLVKEKFQSLDDVYAHPSKDPVLLLDSPGLFGKELPKNVTVLDHHGPYREATRPNRNTTSKWIDEFQDTQRKLGSNASPEQIRDATVKNLLKLPAEEPLPKGFRLSTDNLGDGALSTYLFHHPEKLVSPEDQKLFRLTTFHEDFGTFGTKTRDLASKNSRIAEGVELSNAIQAVEDQVIKKYRAINPEVFKGSDRFNGVSAELQKRIMDDTVRGIGKVVDDPVLRKQMAQEFSAGVKHSADAISKSAIEAKSSAIFSKTRNAISESDFQKFYENVAVVDSAKIPPGGQFQNWSAVASAHEKPYQLSVTKMGENKYGYILSIPQGRENLGIIDQSLMAAIKKEGGGGGFVMRDEGLLFNFAGDSMPPEQFVKIVAEKMAGPKIDTASSLLRSEEKMKPLTPYAERMQNVYLNGRGNMPEREMVSGTWNARKKDWVRSQTFTEISKEDNVAARLAAEQANAGLPTPIKRSVIIESAAKKSLNDAVVREKPLVDGLDNLHKNVTWQALSNSSLLNNSMVGKYNDYKAIKATFSTKGSEIDAELKRIYSDYNSRYGEFLNNVAEAEGWNGKGKGLAQNTRTWHIMGIGDTPYDANLAARKARVMLDGNGLARAVTFEEARPLIEKDIADIRASRELVTSNKNYQKIEGLFEQVEGKTILSHEANEVIRKAEPLANTEEAKTLAIKNALEKHFKAPIEDARPFREYAEKSDGLSPDLYIDEQVKIPWGARDHGVVSFDFRGQGAINLAESMKALARTEGKTLEEQKLAILEGEKAATKILDEKKERVIQAALKIDTEARNFVHISGDDLVFFPPHELTAAEKKQFALDASLNPGDGRLTFTPSHFGDAPGTLIPKENLSKLVSEAEEVEKDLRKKLISTFDRKQVNQAQIVVEHTPLANGERKIGVYLGGRNSARDTEAMRSWIDDYFKNQGKEGHFVEAIPSSASKSNLAIQELKLPISAIAEPLNSNYVGRGLASLYSRTIGEPIARAWEKVKETFQSASKSFFRPINAPSSVKSSAVSKQTANDMKDLEKLGVKFSESVDEPYLYENVNRWKHTSIEKDSAGKLDYGKVLNITELPPPGKAKGPNANAFLHPEMAVYKEKLEKMGYRLTVDTSTPFTGAGAYQWSHTKVVSLRPDSTWATFLHEFQHAEFSHYLEDEFYKMEARALNGRSIRGALPEATIRDLGEERIQKLEELIKKGLPELAVNETLSVGEELKLMGFRRYIPVVGSHEEKYALRHQITELSKIVEEGETLTGVQQQTLKEAKRRYMALLSKDTVGTIGAVGGIAASPIPGSYVYNRLTEPNQDPGFYSQIFYDTKGNAFGQRSDGTWVYLRSLSGKRLPASTTSTATSISR